MATSARSQAITELGKKLVAELRLDDSNDTLSRWVAHYVAEKMDAAALETGELRKTAERECFEAILSLWEHRRVFPDRRRPFKDFENLFSTLSTLDVQGRSFRYFRENPEADELGGEPLKWLRAAEGVDDAARALIRFFLAAACEGAVDNGREWVTLAKGLDGPLGFDVRIVHQIVDDVDGLVKDPIDPENEEVKAMIARLDRLAKTARAIAAHLKKRLK
jgi:hypothetical protein